MQAIIEAAYEQRATLNPSNISSELKSTLNKISESLDKGLLRVAEKRSNTWIINTWIKKAILLMFRANNFAVINANFCQFYDKLPLKFNNYTKEDFEALQTRIVPTAIVRHGAYIGANTILMPSYVNIGAYIDSGAMIDTWATVGSCAQIGKNVHLSGGVGIGGVLEPLQASPTIIEDNCFIGARSEIVEGVIVEEGSVISMGVFIGQSTKIYNRITGEISYGRIPQGSVVVPGSLPSKDGTHQLNAAIIIKQVDAQTREKIGINALLRQD